MSGELLVCAVPIGNLADATPRLRETLASVDVIACEDTRTTRRLLELLDVVPAPRLLAHHDHNERDSAAGIVAMLRDGARVALVSDAGTPAVSDPGTELVAAAHAASIPVRLVPGASAASGAVSVSGAATAAAGGYRFVGFLPRAAAALTELVDRHAGDVLVAFESPHRLARSLEAIATQQPQRMVTVCRELTKLHEQVTRGTVETLAATFADGVKGEVVLVLDRVEQVSASDADEATQLALVQDMVAEGVGLKRATRIVADRLGGSARTLYAAALAERES